MLLKIIINKYKLYIYTAEIKKKNIPNNLQLNSLKYLISLKLHQQYVYSKIIVKKKMTTLRHRMQSIRLNCTTKKKHKILQLQVRLIILNVWK